jgi:hypothetical protein
MRSFVASSSNKALRNASASPASAFDHVQLLYNAALKFYKTFNVLVFPLAVGKCFGWAHSWRCARYNHEEFPGFREIGIAKHRSRHVACPASSCARRCDKPGLAVLIETWIAPRPSTWTRPSSRNVTSVSASSSGSDVRTTSQPARSPRPAAAVAPLATLGLQL